MLTKEKIKSLLSTNSVEILLKSEFRRMDFYLAVSELLSDNSPFDSESNVKDPQNSYCGTTATWVIALCYPELLSQLVEKNPTVNLNAAPQNPQNTHYGVTVASLIALHDPNLLLKLIIEKGLSCDFSAVLTRIHNTRFLTELLIQKRQAVKQNQFGNPKSDLTQQLISLYQSQNYSINFKNILQRQQDYQTFLHFLEIYAAKPEQCNQPYAHDFFEQEMTRFTFDELHKIWFLCLYDPKEEIVAFAPPTVAHFILRSYCIGLLNTPKLSTNDLLNHFEFASFWFQHARTNLYPYPCQESWKAYRFILLLMDKRTSNLLSCNQQQRLDEIILAQTFKKNTSKNTSTLQLPTNPFAETPTLATSDVQKLITMQIPFNPLTLAVSACDLILGNNPNTFFQSHSQKDSCATQVIHACEVGYK